MRTGLEGEVREEGELLRARLGRDSTAVGESDGGRADQRQYGSRHGDFQGGITQQSYAPFTEEQYRFTADSRAPSRFAVGSAGSYPRRNKLSEATIYITNGKPTPEKKDVRNTTQKDADVELSVEELEERIAPVTKFPKK